MLNVKQLRELIIKPALHDIVLFSEDAVELLVFTCAIESFGGTLLKDTGLGIYGMKPDNYNYLWQNYIKHNTNLLMSLIMNFNCNRMPDEERLIYDLRFATVMARIQYSCACKTIPDTDTLQLWNHYKTYYNPSIDDSIREDSINDYITFINHHI